jgi:cytochrome c oxidase subunit 2
MTSYLQLASSGAGFFDATFLYISGGLLVAFALGVALVGIRREDFPNSSQTRAIAGIAAVLVVCTGIGAVQSARFEQSERREKNEEAAKEAQAEDVAKQEEEAPLTEGQGAAPDTATGEASSPQESPGGAAVGAADGKALFADGGCGDCHTLADAGSTGQIGPVLDEVLPGMSADEIRTSIVDPGASTEAGFPEGVMPSAYGDQFTAAEIDALVAYLSDVAGSK